MKHKLLAALVPILLCLTVVFTCINELPATDSTGTLSKSFLGRLFKQSNEANEVDESNEADNVDNASSELETETPTSNTNKYTLSLSSKNSDSSTEWPDPVYKEMQTTKEDTDPGTLKYTTSADGQTVTISYEVNGKTVSYTVPNKNNYLFGGYSGTDDLNRPLYSSDEVGAYSTDRAVGIFYFLWHGPEWDSGIYNLQQIIDQVGVEAAGSTNCGLYGPLYSMHWFDEPLYGYYYTSDEWVLRKHAELLTLANIDFLYFDVTNDVTYTETALKLMKVLHELNEQGFDAPQVVFYTNTNAAHTVQVLYDEIYSKGYYTDTWYCIDGKPVIVAPKEANINDFFTIKLPQWPTESIFHKNAWPWMAFEWPQHIFLGTDGKTPSVINVSVAQHSGSINFSKSSLYGDYTNRGRSFTNPDNVTTYDNRLFNAVLRSSYEAWQNDNSLTNLGLNFQQQWNYAIDSGAETILVTGWNEWVAMRQPNGTDQIGFVDTASREFSRDTEMMRGGYFDNYYIQLIYNIQRTKGTSPIIVQDMRKPINVTGSFDQWDDVIVTYKDILGDTEDRDAMGFGNTHYTNTTGRNDISSAKVTADSKNIYFYVSTVDDITMYDTESSWMQLYVNVDRRDGETGETGWYGYDYIINYKAKDTFTTTVARYNGKDNKFGFETIGEVSYRVKGNEMMIAVPLSMLGIENYEEINLEFKWADSTSVYDEMEDFYCDGNVAPLGRLNYIYQNYTVEETDPVETETDTVKQEPASTEENITSEPTTTENEKPSNGCSSVIASSAWLMMLGICGAACVFRRKKQ